MEKIGSVIKDSLANEDEVVFRNFGSFHIHFYKSKVGRNEVFGGS